jgi:hypothetical protein
MFLLEKFFKLLERKGRDERKKGEEKNINTVSAKFSWYTNFMKSSNLIL